jgi:hypothetical protein
MAYGSQSTKDGFNAMLDKFFNPASTYTIPSRFKIGTGTDTPSQLDSDLQTPIAAWSGGTDYKNFNTTPVLDSANQKVTTQSYISSTEANGNTITEYGEFNTDGTPLMISRTVFIGITKTAAVQAFIITTYKRK